MKSEALGVGAVGLVVYIKKVTRWLAVVDSMNCQYRSSNSVP
jgi:hypothetical protein